MLARQGGLLLPVSVFLLVVACGAPAAAQPLRPGTPGATAPQQPPTTQAYQPAQPAYQQSQGGGQVPPGQGYGPPGGQNPAAASLPMAGQAPVAGGNVGGAPFELSPRQAADIDFLLRAWQQRSSQVQTLTCKFRCWEYDPAFGPAGRARTISEGVIAFAAPDKGDYEVTSVLQWMPNAGNPAEGTYQPSELGRDHWKCDGKAIYEYRPQTKELIEHRLPPEAQGKAISDGPLPFIFGVEAEKMKARYWLRIITPPDRQGEIWLEAWPKYQQDKANFEYVELILSNQDLLPQGLQMHLPNGQPGARGRRSFVFEETVVNSPGHKVQNFFGVFSNTSTPLGWKRIVKEPPSEPPAGSQPFPHQAQGAAGPRR